MCDAKSQFCDAKSQFLDKQINLSAECAGPKKRRKNFNPAEMCAVTSSLAVFLRHIFYSYMCCQSVAHSICVFKGVMDLCGYFGPIFPLVSATYITLSDEISKLLSL